MPGKVRKFSDLLRNPNDVTGHVEQVDVLLRRRGHPDLVLTSAARQAHRDHAVWALTCVLRRLSRDNPAEFDAALTDAFGWATFLPPERREQFAEDLINTLQGAPEVEVFETVTMLINEWQAAAVGCIDPDLAKRMRGSIDAPNRRRSWARFTQPGVMGLPSPRLPR